jgi:hypothetical protein
MEILAGIIGALAAGAVAKAGEIGGRVVLDAYDGLKTLIVNKLKGKTGAVQSVEERPHSEAAQATLAEALTEEGLAKDAELAQLAEKLRAALASTEDQSSAAIEVGDIFGKVNVLVENLVASGRIKLGNIWAETGDATLTNLTAGAPTKKA